MRTFIALAGPSGAGKSTLAGALRDLVGDAAIVSTSKILRERDPALAGDNGALKALGDHLDAVDPGWFLGSQRGSGAPIVIVDAVRSLDQCEVIDRSGRLILVTIGDPPEFCARATEAIASAWIVDVPRRADPRAQALAVVETFNSSEEYHGVIGAQWGSEGKGKVACALASMRSYAAMVRAGGPNAGHRVELPNGEFKVLRHLPSASALARPGTALCIGPGAVIDLAVLAGEVPLVPPECSLVIDPRAAIVDEESRRMEHDSMLQQVGSTMTGTGGAMARRTLRTGLTMELAALDDIPELAALGSRLRIEPVARAVREAATRGSVLFEGTQGMELSLLHGPYPHVTSRDVSPAGLLSECGIPPDVPATWHVVARTYPIRVGGPSGPMPGECEWSDVAKTSGILADDLRGKERTSVTNRLRRVARWRPGQLFEVVRRSIRNPQAAVAWITFADYLSQDLPALAAITREARSCSRAVFHGYGPRTSDYRAAF